MHVGGLFRVSKARYGLCGPCVRCVVPNVPALQSTGILTYHVRGEEERMLHCEK